MRLLIVEDDPNVAKLTEDVLKEFGGREMECVVRPDYTAAEAFLDSEDCDVVLCEGHFPLAAGEKAFAIWKFVWVITPRHIPFILVSGDADCIADAQAMGVPALRKPFGIQELYALVMKEVERGKAGVGIKESGARRK